MSSKASQLIAKHGDKIGEKSCLKQCQDCKKYFYYLEGDKWCEECFDIGLCKDIKDMNDHFDNYMKEEFKQAEGGKMKKKVKSVKIKNKYVIVRTYSAGVFAGFLISEKGQEVILKDSRRLWYWKGAASLSQLAVDGVSKPLECKFPVAIPNHKLTQAIEIIDCTDKAKASIEGVPVWKE